MFVEEKAKGEVKELDAVSKLLLRAAALIEERGLPDREKDEAGRACVILTISELGDIPKDIHDALMKLQLSLGITIATWSDRAGAEGRAHEVISKLRAVAFSS